MTEKDRMDERIRMAVETLPPAPVRWDRIERKARRRRLIGILAMLVAGLCLTVVVAAGLLAGKSAIDPTYSAPILSRDDVTIEFHEPAFGHGLVPVARYIKDAGPLDIPSGVRAGSLGYVFTVSLHGASEEDARLVPRWRLRLRGRPSPVPVTMVPAANEERGRGERSFSVWVEKPTESGQFVVDFALAASGSRIALESSDPIPVVARDLLAPYKTRSYVAGVPRTWDFESDYDPEPGHRFVTRLEGPHEMSVLIDTTLEINGDPADSARSLEGLFSSSEEPYRRLAFARNVLGGPAFEWSYELGEHAATDIFFFRDGDGFAVLAESPPERFREARLVARSVARSVEGSDQPGA